MEAIGTLAGGIAHDFNNILSPILGFSELLRGDLPVTSPLRDYVDEIIRASLKLKNLVKQILTFGRQSDQEIRPIRLQPIIKETLQLIRSMIPTTIDIQHQIDPNCGIVIADPTQIHQVLMNLVTNAYHAMENTGGKLKIILKQVRLGIEQSSFPELIPGEYDLLIVADTGVGIEKDIMDKIFDPYFSTKEKGKGTGLGLSVVQGIVKSCNGDIRIYSEPGKGTEVHVYLPVVSKMADDIKSDRSEVVGGGTEKILLVDDEEVVARMEQEMLERLGYQVTMRTGSVEALEAFRANSDLFDLVITDMTMPNMTGVQLAGEIKKIRPDIPIILCTGFSHQINGEKSKELGLQGFVKKPMIMREIAEIVRKVLDNT
jgi:CheY-like chemotaxis protein/two-component sensor histidine kinase